MPRVTVIDWLNAIETPQGPMPPELRHLCYVLARTLPGDGTGAYLGSRAIGERMGLHRATVSRYISALASAGWLDLEERRTQFGRKGYRYFAAIPLAPLNAPIASDNGARRSANSGNGASVPRRNGAAQNEIGARVGDIGAPGGARLLQTLTEKSAASPSPADTGAAAQRRWSRDEVLARESSANFEKNSEQRDGARSQAVDRLLRAGKSPEETAGELGEPLEFVLVRKRLRDLNPFRKAMP